jgi:hypothetical protein
MIDETKLDRLMELKRQREKIDAEITTLMGGEVPKRKWTRRTPQNEGADQTASPKIGGSL